MSEDNNHIVPVNINPFPMLLAEAISLDCLAHTTDIEIAESVLAKSAITSAALTLECAAHCCMERLDMSKHLIEKLDRELETLQKYDMLHWTLTKQPLDRGIAPVQRAHELIKIRNSLVHRKIIRKEFEIPKNLEDGYAAIFDIQLPPWPMIGIPGNPVYWKAAHSQAVIKVVIEFLNYFFVDACNIGRNTLATMLCTSSGMVWYLNEWEAGMLKTVNDLYGVSILFLDLSRWEE
jgi:hypothetical protein